MSFTELVFLGGAGFLAGAVNGVAGGGSLISFPALLAVGNPAIAAAVTNAVAVLPGYAGGAIGYRRELAGQAPLIKAFAVVSMAGAATGATALLLSSEGFFRNIAPLLVLGATLLLAIQSRLTPFPRHTAGDTREHAPRYQRRGLALQYLSGIYGGYFNAGLGILILAVLGLHVDDNLQRLNALKAVLSFIVGTVAVVFFALFGPVVWSAAAVMAVTSFAGGHAGVAGARRISPTALRRVIVVYGLLISAYLAFRW